MIPDITLFYASLCAILLVILSVIVIRTRFAEQVGIGTGESRILTKAVRVQANFTEYVPLALLLMALAEMHNAPETMIHALGILLVISRLSHAYGLRKSAGPGVFRGGGAVGTMLVLLVAAGWGIYSFLAI